MTHAAETDIEDAVVAWFQDQYGTDAVERQAYLPDVRWFADLRVAVGWGTLYIEVENDAGSIRPGIAQAAAYAATDPAAGVPLVVIPAGHTDTERIDTLRRVGVPVREFDADAETFV